MVMPTADTIKSYNLKDWQQRQDLFQALGGKKSAQGYYYVDEATLNSATFEEKAKALGLDAEKLRALNTKGGKGFSGADVKNLTTDAKFWDSLSLKAEKNHAALIKSEYLNSATLADIFTPEKIEAWKKGGAVVKSDYSALRPALNLDDSIYDSVFKAEKFENIAALEKAVKTVDAAREEDQNIRLIGDDLDKPLSDRLGNDPQKKEIIAAVKDLYSRGVKKMHLDLAIKRAKEVLAEEAKEKEAEANKKSSEPEVKNEKPKEAEDPNKPLATWNTLDVQKYLEKVGKKSDGFIFRHEEDLYSNVFKTVKGPSGVLTYVNFKYNEKSGHWEIDSRKLAELIEKEIWTTDKRGLPIFKDSSEDFHFYQPGKGKNKEVPKHVTPGKFSEKSLIENYNAWMGTQLASTRPEKTEDKKDNKGTLALADLKTIKSMAKEDKRDDLTVANFLQIRKEKDSAAGELTAESELTQKQWIAELRRLDQDALISKFSFEGNKKLEDLVADLRKHARTMAGKNDCDCSDAKTMLAVAEKKGQAEEARGQGRRRTTNS